MVIVIVLEIEPASNVDRILPLEVATLLDDDVDWDDSGSPC